MDYSCYSSVFKRPLNIMAIAVSVLALSACVTGCGHDTPQEPTEAMRPSGGGSSSGPAGPGSGHNPAGSDDPFRKEMDDDVLRVTGLGTDMRYDRGGVLFSTDRDGTRHVRDLDGTCEMRITLGSERRDSTLTGSSIVVDGNEIAVKEIKMMRCADGRTWYRVTVTDSDTAVMVLM